LGAALFHIATQVAAELRNMVEVAYPEAVGRRRAEALRALFTEELRRLVPYGRPADYHAALVEVRGAPSPLGLPPSRYIASLHAAPG